MDMFTLLIAILMYIGAFTPAPSQGYWTSDINTIEVQHHIEVQAVEQDPNQMQIIKNNYYNDASLVEIYDRHEQ